MKKEERKEERKKKSLSMSSSQNILTGKEHLGKPWIDKNA